MSGIGCKGVWWVFRLLESPGPRPGNRALEIGPRKKSICARCALHLIQGHADDGFENPLVCCGARGPAQSHVEVPVVQAQISH